jgi:hypothetical protein
MTVESPSAGARRSSSMTFAEWREAAAELALLLYGHSLVNLEEELVAAYEVGDTPAEFLAGIFTER